MTYSGKRLYRSNTEKTIAGVLGGIAEYFDIDPTLVRLGYVLLSLFSAAFPGVLGYIIMWIVMPQNPNNGAYPNQPPRFQQTVPLLRLRKNHRIREKYAL